MGIFQVSDCRRPHAFSAEPGLSKYTMPLLLIRTTRRRTCGVYARYGHISNSNTHGETTPKQVGGNTPSTRR
jgi:hypothetical protein